MIKLSRADGLRVWDRFWDNAKFEFFKVEDLQDYADEKIDRQSSLGLWLGGDKKAALDYIQRNKSEWAEQTRSKNITKIRVHVVDEPFSEYLQWEIEHYRLVNIPLGHERVYLVPRTAVPDYTLGDFMLFDQRSVTKSSYSASGRLQGMDIYENEPISEFLEAKTLLMQYAVEITP